MNLKKILLAAGLGIMISNVSAQTSRRYTVAKPGTLVEMLTEEEANEITHLVLQGKLNAVDFRHLRDEFKKLQILDISNASISMYAGKNGTHPDRRYTVRQGFGQQVGGSFLAYAANLQVGASLECTVFDVLGLVGKDYLRQGCFSGKSAVAT